jgi:hypothetical protein
MTKFARDCRHAMADVCCRLEKILGPDTGELQIRFGLHSGPVTGKSVGSIKLLWLSVEYLMTMIIVSFSWCLTRSKRKVSIIWRYG